jgi:hypothetical protein
MLDAAFSYIFVIIDSIKDIFVIYEKTLPGPVGLKGEHTRTPPPFEEITRLPELFSV